MIVRIFLLTFKVCNWFKSDTTDGGGCDDGDGGGRGGISKS